MSSIITRTGKGSALEWAEVDSNFTNLNTDKYQEGSAIGSTTPAAGTFTEVAVTTATGNSAFNENDTITGWVYSGNSFSVIGQESNPNGLFIGSAGTKMYVNGTTGDDVNEYTLGTAWDITTATFVTAFSTAGQDTGPIDIFFKPDGLSMFIMGSTNDTVFQYTLGTAWSVSTASYASKSFSVTAQEVTPSGLWFKTDGTVMYVVGTTSDAVFQYALSTAWDVSTASYGGISYSFAAQETIANQVNLSNDGLKMWVLGQQGDDIWEYDLGTAWNVSTATPVNNIYIGFQETTPSGLFIDSTAPNRVYMVGTANDTVFQYYTEGNSLKLDTSKLYVSGVLSVNDNFVAGQNAYIDGTLIVQGQTTLSTTTITGTPTIGTSTSAITISLGTGSTASGSTKAINIGTAGLSGSTTNITLGSAVSGSLGTTTIQAPTVNIGQTATQFSVINTASAVNFVQVTGAATGGIPAITVQGSDSNISGSLVSKGSGTLRFLTNTTIEQLRVLHTGSAVNYLTATGSATGQGVVFSVAGTDTNISQVFQTKGTGAIDLAAGSSGVNISNGGTVTAITQTAGGSYTSVPTVAITAPTTAGGVQATATVNVQATSSTTIASGGTGYTVNDVLTVVGGTGTASQITVATVSAGVITGITISTAGNYSATASNPVSVTGGTGSGATFNMVYTMRSGTFTITNAGSGYVEQPTVTFSGGGGSGAAAYASVGSATTIKTLFGTTTSGLDLATPAGTQVRIADIGDGTRPLQLNGGSAGSVQVAGIYNATSGAALALSTNGGTIAFYSGGRAATEQARVSHTASAVNYVQVTGAATGGSVQITTQGSDTNIGTIYGNKGVGSHSFRTQGTTSIQFQVTHTTNAVNRLEVTGGASGVAPVLSAAGTDTNIDLTLTPKGTGNVRFGTFTSSILTPTGYVEIKDSGGTIRRLLVG